MLFVSATWRFMYANANTAVRLRGARCYAARAIKCSTLEKKEFKFFVSWVDTKDMERRFLIVALVAAGAQGCFGGFGLKSNPCETETCSGHGQCSVTTEEQAIWPGMRPGELHQCRLF